MMKKPQVGLTRRSLLAAAGVFGAASTFAPRIAWSQDGGSILKAFAGGTNTSRGSTPGSWMNR